MILLHPVERSAGDPLVAIFGVGLIGNAVLRELGSAARMRAQHLGLDWTDVERQRADLRIIRETVLEALARRSSVGDGRSGGLPRLSVVWSAGRAGFGATATETEQELDSFQRVLTTVEGIAERASPATVQLFLISSAGGLFEGQRHVDRGSRPSPQRPYGALKLAQEEMLITSPAPLGKRIYRLTSVYGQLAPHQRRGLIATLILNGIYRRETHISGRMSTLRDYTWLGDIAAYLAERILADRGTGSLRRDVLASARPYSLYQIQRMVEETIRHRLYIHYSHERSNSADITFSDGILPEGWRPSALEANIDRIYQHALSRGGAFASAAG